MKETYKNIFGGRGKPERKHLKDVGVDGTGREDMNSALKGNAGMVPSSQVPAASFS